ncbi:hypothetical protein LP419_38205 [Massilia sp. H-1]|nr:hypothetical protein LP419_38205 [Massilia sp. H-1]
MKNIVLTLDPGLLENPDLDLRYAVPDLLAARSNGNVKDNGYDYEDQEDSSGPHLAIFLVVNDFSAALALIKQVVLTEVVLENDLAPAAALYIQDGALRKKVPLS